MTRRRSCVVGRPAALVILAALIAGCVGRGGPSLVPTEPTAAAAPSTRTESPAATPGVDDPPVASLRVEGGDPVVGQLGTYTWADSGSSSPWLPGAPIAVGAQETLTLTVDPPSAITTWTAQIAEATDLTGDHAVTYASGQGQPVMGAPRSGSWTLAVTVRFGELGTATYSWRLDVS